VINLKQTPPVASINLLNVSKPVRFLESLKRMRFSGQLVFTSSKEEQWFFYLYLGQIIYGTGGTHPVRRWKRNLAIHCPQIPFPRSEIQDELFEIDKTALINCWEYQLLCLWIVQREIKSEQATKMIRAVITEVLFDIVQASRVIYQVNQDDSLSKPIILIDVHEAVTDCLQFCQVWRDAKIAEHSLNGVPVIKQPEVLQKRTSAQIYQTLIKLLDGQHTLRDLAVKMKRNVVEVTRSLLPYIQSDLVDLISIPDLPAPFDIAPPENSLTPTKKTTGALIACVDDSPLVCKTMEGLLTAAGYRFIGVEDGMRAFGTLLTYKPEVIFLDLVMPNTNGYEICTQLRKVSCFRNTPIVILTGNDGIVDRVRAKLIGASDFLSKPIDAGTVLSVIRKHLEQGVISN
jgi:chemotaxis family two-component system response regulator PixG